MRIFLGELLKEVRKFGEGKWYTPHMLEAVVSQVSAIYVVFGCNMFSAWSLQNGFATKKELNIYVCTHKLF